MDSQESPAPCMLKPLSACKELETLEILYARGISDLSPLSSCTRLKKFQVIRSEVTDLNPLMSIPLLEELVISKPLSSSLIKDLYPLSRCKKLRMLKDLSPLCQCPDLEGLYIDFLPLIKDLSFFEKGFTKLRVLDITYLKVKDLSPLTRLKNLEELDCWGIPQTTSLLPLARCCKLKQLNCSRNAIDLDELKEKRTERGLPRASMSNGTLVKVTNLMVWITL
jgi:Leucine-rich repeat (LRR) protein